MLCAAITIAISSAKSITFAFVGRFSLRTPSSNTLIIRVANGTGPVVSLTDVFSIKNQKILNPFVVVTALHFSQFLSLRFSKILHSAFFSANFLFI